MIRNNGLALVALLCVLGCDRSGHGESIQVASGVVSAVAVSPQALAGAANAVAAGAANAVAVRLLAVGDIVPDVAATAQDGTVVRLRALKGKPLIVYFYPKDDTPGCTIEAKGIRDQYAALNARAMVLGVSEDSLDSHKAFASKYDLPFRLLDDSTRTLTTAFGVPVSASGHAKRVTFVIDAAGLVRKVFPDVNPDGHAAELLEALKSLG